MECKLDLVTQSFIDKLCAIKVDVFSVAKSIKTCCRLLELADHARISIKIKHKLCRSLAISYFILLEQESDFPEILSYIRITLTCMSLLKQSTIASHILCQALLERSLVYGHLFNEELVEQKNQLNIDSLNDNYINLSEENHKATLGHRFRRLPNFHGKAVNLNQCNDIKNPPDAIIKMQTNDDDSIPDKRSINCYLLIEAFKSSINNIEAFASLFVEFHCPVTFDKLNWPNDEALRVTNEKNLSTLRRFEQIPPLWDLYELIGQAGCLGSCLTLVKALFTANLALWSSATTNSTLDKMSSTMRLIPPLAQSGLVPKAFGMAVEVFPQFSSAEVFAVLTDIWLYLKDTNSPSTSSTANSAANQSDDTPNETELKSTNDKQSKARAKVYLNRLRLFMCQHNPGKEYVKLFKEFYEEPPAVIEIPIA